MNIEPRADSRDATTGVTAMTGRPGTVRPGLAESRYVLPSFVERTPYGIKEMNPYNKLFEERIIFLGVQIDDASANDVMAQLITLESIDPDRDILVYINSPGGSMTSMMAIYDTMQYVKPDIQTFCLGQAALRRAGFGGPGQAGLGQRPMGYAHGSSSSPGFQETGPAVGTSIALLITWSTKP